jgi:hypothetical protein
MKNKKDFVTSWKFPALMFIVFFFCLYGFVWSVSHQLEQIDQNGGLKSVVERVWNGANK